MRNMLIICLTVFFVSLVKAQKPEIRKSFMHRGQSFDLIIIKTFSNPKLQVSFFDNEQKIPDVEVATLDTLSMFVTASIVDSSCNPLGLYINNGKEIHKLNSDSVGKGNFFLPENGILSISEGNRFEILKSKAFKSENDVRYAIQTGPLLVNYGKINPLFGINSTNKNMRCGVGIFVKDTEEYIVFARPNVAINYYDFASLFLNEFHCTIALNLESGSNATMHLPGMDNFSIDGSICRYLKIKFSD